MRNFEERKAEVFRRSKKRIEERKRRWKYVSFVLLVFMFTMFSWGVLFEDAEDKTVRDEMGSAENTHGGDASYIQVLVQSEGKIVQIENEVSQIYSLVQGAFEDADKVEDGYQEPADDLSFSDSEAVLEENEKVFDATSSTVSCEYRINFVASDGNYTVYTLEGTTLVEEVTKKEAVLTQEQYWQLLTLLGLPND